MTSRIFLILLATVGLLASCAHIEPHPMDMTSAIRNAKSGADHYALARHYEDAAKSMQAKADQQKKMLTEYQDHGYYYGRQTEDLIEHSQALARVYEEAANANMNLAHYHRRLADDVKQ
ncbi:hypothetical protein [Nitrosovibrio tenuis]|uniref:DUF4398 domain-containing protein n=1 Tax=Nitrosovibrio tenuis TaxID=1233 RepID=A0A1H7IVZ1_9PROT|nr:hypothetical protein [Nitrosovibrio tenuis]SEK66683.1 hypothetical protein SAMN05216387_102317 [Nitrosovibrio tenuis]